MKLNPPASSSDLETARTIASRLSVAAYGRRARKPAASASLTRPVEAAAPPLGEVHRVTAPPVPAAVSEPPATEPAATAEPVAPIAEPAVVPDHPRPAPEALAPHEEPPLAAAEPAPAPQAAPAHVPEAAAPAPPPAPPAVEARQDSGSVTLHRPKSRVDALLQQALGRASALGTSSHRAEPAHEPFVPIPAPTPDTHASEPAAPAHEPHAEPPLPPAADDDQRARWEAFVPVEAGSSAEERTNPSFRVPEEAVEAPQAERFEAPVTAEEGTGPATETAAPLDVEAPAVEEPAQAAEAAVDEPAPTREALDAETPPEPPFDTDAEPPIPVDGAAFDAPAPESGNVFDPSGLVGGEAAAAESPVPEPEPAPEPPPPPSWPDVLDRCLNVATTARGALVAGADGRLLASAGHWPAKAEAIASKLVPLIEKAPRPATDDPLPIKLGPNVLSSWQFHVDGELVTAAFIGEAALPAHVWPELKATLRR